jgi:hypothetical protein
MDEKQFQALSEHVQLEAGKYGLVARLVRDMGDTIECCVFDPTARHPQPTVVTFRSFAQCDRLGVKVFDDFILRVALPRLRPKG